MLFAMFKMKFGGGDLAYRVQRNIYTSHCGVNQEIFVFCVQVLLLFEKSWNKWQK